MKCSDVKVHTVAGQDVIVISNFLPEGEALKMVAEMKSEHWVYTTNHESGNKKHRGNYDEKNRRAAVERNDRNGYFSYSKYELEPESELNLHVRNLFKGEVLHRVEEITGMQFRGVTESFVTRYGLGDFLSYHDDGISGSLAFVLNLTEDWTEEDGGVLEFACKSLVVQARSDLEVCLRLVPTFNSLVLFRTRQTAASAGLQHRVTRIQADKHRYAVTGWYLEANDEYSDHEREQCRQMKGANCVDDQGY